MVYYGLSLGPPWVEGLRNTVRALSRRLVDRGFEVTVLSSTLSSNIRMEGVHYLGLNVGGQAYSEKAPQALAAMARWVARHSSEFDIVHGHSSFTLPSLIGLFSSVPSVFTLYSYAGASGVMATDAGPLESAVLRLAKSSLTALVSSSRVRFVAISDGVRESLPARVSAACRVIPLGVDYERFSRRVDLEGIRSELGLEGSAAVLFAGDVTPWKGGEDFIRAAALVSKTFRERVRYLFLTKGTYEREAERLRALRGLVQRLGISDQVVFLGRRSDIEAVYQVSDVVVLPYRSVYTFMSTPLSLLEAMSAARPIVASRVGDIPTIVKDGVNGLLFEPGDAFELASKTARLLCDPKYARTLGRAASEEARRRDWSNIAERYVELYGELCGGQA